MIDIKVVSYEELTTEETYGVYVIQCQIAPSIYRVGCSSQIKERIRKHAGGTPRARTNAPNWTERMQPWKPIWIAALPTDTIVAAELCERYLFSMYSTLYPFVSQSGFNAESATLSDIRDVANSSLPALAGIVKVQTGKYFNKRAKS
jgi:predicted GIY-YIG superfamily endonuclease